MKYLLYLLAIIILVGINIGLFNNLQIGGQIPNLLLLLVLYFSLDKDSYDFFFLAFVSGIFLDFYSADAFGAFTLAFLLVAISARILSSRVVVLEANWKYLTLLLLGSLLCFDLVVWLYGLAAYSLGLSLGYVSIRAFTASLIPGFFYNWLLLYPMYMLYDFLKNLIDGLTIRRRGIIR